MRRVILSEISYQKYFNFQKPKTGCLIEQENFTKEFYFSCFTYLPTSFFNIENSNLIQIINSLIGNDIYVRFELFAISADLYDEFYIFKPWILDIDIPDIYNALENFHLYMPSRFFYTLISSQLFAELFSIEQMEKIRILQDIPIVNFSKNGLDREFVPSQLDSNKISMLRLDAPPINEIIDFYTKNWVPIEKLKEKYFNKSHNIWFKIISSQSNNILIGYFRLYTLANVKNNSFLIEYIIDKEYRNKGYATEAIKLIKEYVAKFSYARYLDAEVDELNQPSINLLLKENFIHSKLNSLFSKTNYSYKLEDEIKRYSNETSADEIIIYEKYLKFLLKYL